MRSTSVHRCSLAIGIVSVVAAMFVAPATADVMAAGSPPQTAAPARVASCVRTVSDASWLGIVASGLPPTARSQAYWWDKADLTISVELSPTEDPEQVAAVEQAVVVWQQTLQDCLNGAVHLDYVPAAPGTPATSDIVVRVVKNAGGLKWAGHTICGGNGSCTIVVDYGAPPGQLKPIVPVAPTWHTEGVAMHEIGHALGLGHADNLWTGFDLMAYGWALMSVNYGKMPDISQCDVDALAYVWSWAIAGTAPEKPTATTYTCGRG